MDVSRRRPRSAAALNGSRGARPPAVVYRHTLLVRITHWINALCFLFLVPSGIAILIAHPELYWGETGYFGAPAALTFPIEPNFNHTGWGRGMHFFFAWILVVNGLVYLMTGVLSRRQRRKLLPARDQLRWRHLADELRNHLRFRPPQGDGSGRYNLLQKVSYLVVALLLFPLMVLSGLAMSPAIVSAFPELLDSFGGRQSARTIHFIAAGLLVLFFLVHLLEVFLVGVVKEVRSMITGRWVVRDTPRPAVGRARQSRRTKGELTRRTLLAGGLVAGGYLVGRGAAQALPAAFRAGEAVTLATHRRLLAVTGQPLAPEYGIDRISPEFPAIGTLDPEDDLYQRLRRDTFVDWRLPIAGLVERPLSLSLADLRGLPARTQITAHSCERGWTAIAQWTGVQLSRVLEIAGPKPSARYVVVRCVDGWYDSYRLDAFEALHPQTILAYGMNGADLPIRHGAPVRLRVERQLGWKSLKFVTRIELVSRLDGIGEGTGSYVADFGFQWYGGI